MVIAIKEYLDILQFFFFILDYRLNTNSYIQNISSNIGGSASINGGALYMMYCYVNGIPYEISKEKSYSPIPAY